MPTRPSTPVRDASPSLGKQEGKPVWRHAGVATRVVIPRSPSPRSISREKSHRMLSRESKSPSPNLARRIPPSKPHYTPSTPITPPKANENNTFEANSNIPTPASNQKRKSSIKLKKRSRVKSPKSPSSNISNKNSNQNASKDGSTMKSSHRNSKFSSVHPIGFSPRLASQKDELEMPTPEQSLTEGEILEPVLAVVEEPNPNSTLQEKDSPDIEDKGAEAIHIEVEANTTRHHSKEISKKLNSTDDALVKESTSTTQDRCQTNVKESSENENDGDFISLSVSALTKNACSCSDHSFHEAHGRRSISKLSDEACSNARTSKGEESNGLFVYKTPLRKKQQSVNSGDNVSENSGEFGVGTPQFGVVREGDTSPMISLLKEGEESPLKEDQHATILHVPYGKKKNHGRTSGDRRLERDGSRTIPTQLWIIPDDEIHHSFVKLEEVDKEGEGKKEKEIEEIETGSESPVFGCNYFCGLRSRSGEKSKPASKLGGKPKCMRILLWDKPEPKKEEPEPPSKPSENLEFVMNKFSEFQSVSNFSKSNFENLERRIKAMQPKEPSRAPPVTNDTQESVHTEGEDANANENESAESSLYITKLIKRLSSKEVSKKMDSLLEIRTMAKNSEKAKSDLAMHGIIPLLINILESQETEQVKEMTTLALLNLAVGNERNKLAIVAAGAIPHLINLFPLLPPRQISVFPSKTNAQASVIKSIRDAKLSQKINIKSSKSNASDTPPIIPVPSIETKHPTIDETRSNSGSTPEDLSVKNKATGAGEGADTNRVNPDHRRSVSFETSENAVNPICSAESLTNIVRFTSKSCNLYERVTVAGKEPSEGTRSLPDFNDRSSLHELDGAKASASAEAATAVILTLTACNDLKSLLASRGVIQMLIQMLVRGSSQAQYDAVRALLNLAVPRNRPMLIESDAISLLLKVISEGSITCCEKALSLMQKLTSTDEGMFSLAKEDRSVSVLVNAIRLGNRRGKEYAVSVLHQLCVFSPLAKKEAISMKIIPLLTDLKSQGSSSCQITATKLLDFLKAPTPSLLRQSSPSRFCPPSAQGSKFVSPSKAPSNKTSSRSSVSSESKPWNFSKLPNSGLKYRNQPPNSAGESS